MLIQKKPAAKATGAAPRGKLDGYREEIRRQRKEIEESAAALPSVPVNRKLDSPRRFRARLGQGENIESSGAVRTQKSKSDKLGSSPAKEDFAGQGDVDPAGERSEGMTTPSASVILSGLSAVLSSRLVLAPSVKKVRFATEADADKGFAILYESGYGVRCFPDETFGIAAQEQLERLDSAGVRYEVVA